VDFGPEYANGSQPKARDESEARATNERRIAQPRASSDCGNSAAETRLKVASSRERRNELANERTARGPGKDFSAKAKTNGIKFYSRGAVTRSNYRNFPHLSRASTAPIRGQTNSAKIKRERDSGKSHGNSQVESFSDSSDSPENTQRERKRERDGRVAYRRGERKSHAKVVAVVDSGHRTQPP